MHFVFCLSRKSGGTCSRSPRGCRLALHRLAMAQRSPTVSPVTAAWVKEESSSRQKLAAPLWLFLHVSASLIGLFGEWLGCTLDWVEFDVEAELFEACGEALGFDEGGALVEMGGAEIDMLGAVFEHVVDRGQD